MSAPTRRHRLIAIRVALAVSFAAVVWVLWPYWGWLVLAGWFAALTRPALARLARFTRGRTRAAAIITLAFTLVVFAPITLMVASLTVDAINLVHTFTNAESGRDALEDLVGDQGGVVPEEPDSAPLIDAAAIPDLVRAHSDSAFQLLGTLAGSVVQAILGFLVLFSGAFTLLVHGPTLFSRIEEVAPASHAHMRRLRDAFIETGRGLLIGSGLTGLVQAIIATGIYFALDVPRAVVLGLLTLVASVIPGVGTALIWVPVTAGLVLAGRTHQAIAMGILGTIFVSGIDSVIRPFFVRWGRLQLSPFIVMVSVFGGLATVGAWGILLGPIVLRLSLEVLSIAREERIL